MDIIGDILICISLGYFWLAYTLYKNDIKLIDVICSLCRKDKKKNKYIITDHTLTMDSEIVDMNCECNDMNNERNDTDNESNDMDSESNDMNNESNDSEIVDNDHLVRQPYTSNIQVDDNMMRVFLEAVRNTDDVKARVEEICNGYHRKVKEVDLDDISIIENFV